MAGVVIAAAGVLLTADEAAFIAGALNEFVRVLAERRSQPTPKLAHTISQLRRATRKCGGFRANDTQGGGNATNSGSSRADETDAGDDLGYATVSTGEAASMLAVRPGAVRAMAQRNPSKLGSVRVGGRWRHDLARVQERRARKTGQRYLVTISPSQHQ